VAVRVVRSNIDRILVLYSIARRLLITFGAGHPNLNLTAEEKRVYGLLFRAADPDGFDVVSGDVAVKFFEKTKLPPDVLGQVGPLPSLLHCGCRLIGIRSGRSQIRKTEDY
jgi:hypothetical protein